MRLVIGDIHGCLRAFEALLAEVAPSPSDLIITLGDYVDRGPNSKGVIEKVLALRETHKIISLMGNHEIQMLRALETRADRERFLSGACGGRDTLANYGGDFKDVPTEHWLFMEKLALFHEEDDAVLVHGGLDAKLPIAEQDCETYYYHRFYSQKPLPSGKLLVCGHTVQGDLPTDLGFALCLDTCAYGGGWLTGYDLDSEQFWQANEKGKTRSFNRQELAEL